jgi:hypothetical protein
LKCGKYKTWSRFCQVEDVEVELNDPSWTIFRAVQQLIQLADLGSRQEKLRRIWEPTYTLVDRIMCKMLNVSGEKLSLLVQICY